MIVRPARRFDRAELLRLRQLLWPGSEEAEVDDVLDRPDSLGVVLVAERREGTLGGFAEIGLRGYAEGCSSSPVAYLEGIWVDPDARRSGVGTALVRESESWAAERGLVELASDCDLQNAVSLGFHLGTGFEESQRVICFHRDVTGAGRRRLSTPRSST